MRNSRELNQMATRIGSAFVLMIVLVVSASAYTVVLRDGRRIEIPAHFVVTPTTLTYEVSPSIQITLQMALIDVAATEKANNESPGSLLSQSRQSMPAPVTVEEFTPRPRRTITNRDLDASMHRRRESELAYETRRRQLGLPTIEESRRRAAREEEVVSAQLKERRGVESETESYWRERASALRTEMAALDAEINYLRVQLDQSPDLTGGFTSFSAIAPFGYGEPGLGSVFGNRSFFPGAGNTRRPHVWLPPGSRSPITGRIGFGSGPNRGHGFVNPGSFRSVQPTGIGFPPYYGMPDLVFGSSSQPYDFAYERGALITRFNELAAARAGLNARWRELEDEARRAGARLRDG